MIMLENTPHRQFIKMLFLQFERVMAGTTKSNIWKLYGIKISKWFMLYMPYVVPFYTSNNLDMHQIMILQAVYSVAIVALEIPSGYFADVIGRRRTLILGTILGTIGFAIYSFSYGFLGFLLAELVLGFGQSFISGADSAMLYDSLLDNKKEKDYMKYEGRMVSIGNIAEASAGIVGGLIALISLRHNIYGQAVLAFLAIPAAIMLVEPAQHERLKTFTFRTILNVVRDSLFVNKQLRTNIFLSAAIGTATLTMAWFAQPYFEHVGLPLTLYGLLWTLLNLVVGFAAMAAYRVETRVGPKRTVLAIAVLIPVGYLLLGMMESMWALSILFFFYIVRGIATPVLKDYIHRHTASNVRATVLSVRNFIIRLCFVLVAPAMGYMTDNIGLQTALLFGGTVFLVLGLLFGLLFWKYNSN
jgi:MFS family permease